MTENKDPGFSLTIAVFSHVFQGPFEGELINQIRQYCAFRNIRFIGFCTGTTAQYNSELNLQQIDAAIIVRNSVSNEFAKKLLDRNIPTISIAYDYFPLSIPVVNNDNGKGIDLVFDYLKPSEHKSIAFIGDLKRFDIRKRYERYAELMEGTGIAYQEELVINSDSSDFNSGFSSGKQFIARGCNASAIIFGSSHLAIGFINCLQEYSTNLTDKLEFIAFGAIPLVPVICPTLSTVDLNIQLLAYRAASNVINMFEGRVIDKDSLKVAPKLITKEELHESQHSPYLATSPDITELNNPNYVATLINNNYLWCRDIFNSNLDKLMSIAPVFAKFMNKAALTRLSNTAQGNQVAKVLKYFSYSDIQVFDTNKHHNVSSADAFPPEQIVNLRERYDVVSHFFIHTRGNSTAVLSIYGDSTANEGCSSYIYLAGLMETLVGMLELRFENIMIKQINNFTTPEHIIHEEKTDLHPIHWDIQNRMTEWSSEALALLDIETEFDINIYQNMDITDRVHDDDIERLRKQLSYSAIHGEPFSTTFRIKNKAGDYVTMVLQADITDTAGEISNITLNVGLLDRHGQP